jgi:autotransporter adhesin
LPVKPEPRSDLAVAPDAGSPPVVAAPAADFKKISNVADGTNPNDVVNLSQLKGVGDEVTNIKTELDGTKKTIASLDGNAVKYTPDVTGNKTNEVKLQGGDLDAPVLIKNVAAGKDDTDGVNVRQLKNTVAEHTATVNNQYVDQSKAYTDNSSSHAVSTANSYTDSKTGALANEMDEKFGAVNDKFNQLSSDIGSVRHEARQAAAIGLAASSLRFDNTPGKLSVAMGGGVWRDQGAMAFGAGYTSETGKVRANVTGVTSNGQVGVGAGISFTLN